MESPGADPAAVIPARRRYPAWAVVAVAAAMMAGGMLLLVAVVAFTAHRSVNPRAKGLARTTLRDGTILVVEHVSIGTEHRFVHELASNPWDLLGGSQRKSETFESTQQPTMKVWLSRHDPNTGAALDIDWWTRTIAVDESGWSVEDAGAGRVARSRQSARSESGSRPFDPLSQQYERVDGYSKFPLMHVSSGKLHLKIYDTAGLAAEVDVPINDAATRAAHLQPEPLPATRADGDLQATLNGLKLVSHGDGQIDEPAGTRREIIPELVLSKAGGTPATDWTVTNLQFTDAHGNVDGGTLRRINPFDPAWRLRITAWRKIDAPFEAPDIWDVGMLTLPQPGAWEAGGTSRFINGRDVRHVGIGTGTIHYRDQVQTRSQSSTSSTGAVGGHEYSATVDLQSNTRSIHIASDMPCLVFDVSGTLGEDHQFLLRVTDERGQPVNTHPFGVDTVQLCFLLSQPDLKAVNVQVIVHKSAEFEFTVAPPAELRTPVETPAPGEVGKPPRRAD